MFEHPKRVHIASSGAWHCGRSFLGSSGGTTQYSRQQQLDLIPFAVANLLHPPANRHGVGADWRTRKQAEGTPTATPVASIIEYAQRRARKPSAGR